MPQELGNVNENREALIRVQFVAGREIDCVIDTGFDGALILPAEFVQELDLPILAQLQFELVGGARMSADVALGEIQWLGRTRTVEVILSNSDDALLRTEMLAGAELFIDYANGVLSITQ